MAIQNITIEDVETLAASLEEEATARRAKLGRLIRAYARIVATREPDALSTGEVRP